MSEYLTSPFMSVAEKTPSKPSPLLRILILSNLQAVPQRIAQLSQYLSKNKFSFTIDLILAVGISRPTENPSSAELGNDSATIAELEQICSRVVYAPGHYESAQSWDTRTTHPPNLTPASLNAIVGPVHITDDLVVVHRRYADGLTEKPEHQLPLSWRQTLYSKLMRPTRFREPKKKSAIVLCSSQLPNHSSKFALLSTVRSLLSLTKSIPETDYILAIAPPKMQRVPSSSHVIKIVERIYDPGSFAEGYFCIAELKRPSVWDPCLEPDVDDDELACETAWEVVKISKYNMERPLGDDDDRTMVEANVNNLLDSNR